MQQKTTNSDVTFLTVQEAARRWRVHPLTIYRHLATGQIRGIRVGRAWRVPLDDLRPDTNVDDVQPHEGVTT